jgi:hypothetical protein
MSNLRIGVVDQAAGRESGSDRLAWHSHLPGIAPGITY